MIKPILIPIDNKPSKGDVFNCPELKKHKLMIFGSFELDYVDICKKFDIILVDTEAEIVERDWCYRTDTKEVFQAKGVSDKFIGQANTGGVRKDLCVKIISSTNKSHTSGREHDDTVPFPRMRDKPLPQLSPQSKQLLIKYYNEHKCMPESVDVETRIENEVLWHANELSPEANNVGKPRIVKLNHQGEIDITIPEVEEKFYTEEEVYELCLKAMNDAHSLNCLPKITNCKEWFKKFGKI